MLSPEHIEAEKSAAAYQLAVQMLSVEVVERSRTGGLDSARATGRVVEVMRTPRRRSAEVLIEGAVVAFDVRAWAAQDRDREPPGPDRLYWGPGAPRELIEIWGSFRGDEFVVAVFERVHPRGALDSSQGVDRVLERIDQITAAFVGATLSDVAADMQRITGLRLLPVDSDAGHLRAEAPAADGWALGAELRKAGDSRILSLTVSSATCVRRSDMADQIGPDGRPIPVPPTRTLPAPWFVECARTWGFIQFGFLMTEPHDYDGCLVDVVLRQEL